MYVGIFCQNYCKENKGMLAECDSNHTLQFMAFGARERGYSTCKYVSLFESLMVIHERFVYSQIGIFCRKVVVTNFYVFLK